MAEKAVRKPVATRPGRNGGTLNSGGGAPGTGRPSNIARQEMRAKLTPERIDKIASIIDSGEVSQQLQAFKVLCDVGIAKSLEIATASNEEIMGRVMAGLAAAVPDVEEYDRIAAIIAVHVETE